MKVITKPEEEARVLAPAKPGATAEEVYASMVKKAESCVDHLCGCSCNHQGC